MYTVATVLHKETGFAWDNVVKLEDETVYRGRLRNRFVCLTDMVTEDAVYIESLPLLHGWAWPWARLELFRRGLFRDTERVLYLDLSLLKEKIDWEHLLFNADRNRTQLSMLAGPERGYDTRLMLWTAGDWYNFYDRFVRASGANMRQFKTDAQWIETIAGHRAKRLDKNEVWAA